ncbi:MAG: outer membrane protein assembly factor BamC [Gammaproteobacteria bacterium]|jgi:outer membrane protein assembly factor BamC|nr:outer membrane protein assembly factor BamC [Gammaproteobacteria bacterium]MBT4606135.1 outer membrane protein assembly factor BamC [Thiotrichales bacterium]MBT3472007.1 outer membrane protein assembly factor BamC [Gammaproteobacteria bacterium]MBT3968509.1 outer membrane protein assembly factor BamC [Gammaproteobacteria bacterium]MBT4079579.1 outer membrane protein assembly factor BamC [Gammaproteobacteria bacterium]
MNKIKTATVLLSAATLSACGTVDEAVDSYEAYKKELSYESSVEVQPLEVPPDLTTASMQDLYQVPGGVTTLKSYESDGGAGGLIQRTAEVMPIQKEIRVVRDGDQRWLEIQATPEQLWSKLREFWMKNGFLINREDPRIGIMETDWAENRAEIADGPIRGLLSKAIDAVYSTGTRDKFRLRLERSEQSGVTELYLSHRRMEEVPAGESFVWQPQPAMPELEAELLSRIMSFLGMESSRANATLSELEGKGVVERARIVDTKGGERFLLIKEGFPRIWRRAGHALDRVGFTVEDRDRTKGVYYVRYIDPFKDNEQKGILDKLKFWGGEDQPAEGEYQIRVESHKEVSRILVLDNSGKVDRSGTARRILTLLHEQLK